MSVSSPALNSTFVLGRALTSVSGTQAWAADTSMRSVDAKWISQGRNHCGRLHQTRLCYFLSERQYLMSLKINEQTVTQ